MDGGQAISVHHGVPDTCTRVVPTWLIVLDNAPTMVMFALGAALLWLIWWPFSIIFLVYGGLSIVLFWGLICPHCHHFDTRACPCGYGVIAPTFFKFKGTEDFKRVFKRNLTIMYPGWIVPFLAGVYLLRLDPTLLVLGLFISFCLIGFVAIPAISKFIGCKGCEIKDQCPWMM